MPPRWTRWWPSAWCWKGGATEALELAGRLVDGMEEQGSPRGVALVQRVRGYALLQADDLAGARAAFEASRESALELKADYELVLTLVALGRAGRTDR